MDQLLNAFQAMDSKFQGQQKILNSHTQSIAKLESQMGQIVNTLNRREEGRLPG
jgi:archaellum component FlaC